MTSIPTSPLQASDAVATPEGGVTGVAVPAGSPVILADPPKDPSQPPDHFVWTYAVSMVMELKEGYWALSLGRVLLLALFAHACVTWSMGHDIPDHEMGTLYGMLGYVFAGKVAGAVQQWQK